MTASGTPRHVVGEYVIPATGLPGLIDAVIHGDGLRPARYLVASAAGTQWHDESDLLRSGSLEWPALDPVGTTSPSPAVDSARPWVTHPSVHAPKCYDCRHHGMGLEGSVGQCLHPSQPRSLVSGVSLVAPGTARGDKANCGPDGTLFEPATADTASLANRLRSRRDTV